MDFNHISVLLEDSVDLLNVIPNGIYADGTLGGGGHSSLICSELSSGGTLIGIDRDNDALCAAKERLSNYNCTVLFAHNNFCNIKNILAENQIASLNGAILDLGVSSHQLDTAERGFSYNTDARLDMRMDQTSDKDAYSVVNTYDEKRLADIIYKYGEERYSKRISKTICERRKIKPIETTLELAEIIKSAFPPSERYADKHPAKRSFQAIRIEVNNELDSLESAVRDFVDCLKLGGRLAIITFHSLEDRIVKNTFAELASGCTCPKDFPVCVCGKKPAIKLINKKPIIADKAELERNFRAHSAKLRVIEKI